jgi:predicted DNA-binding transcriptional regulator AlpA
MSTFVVTLGPSTDVDNIVSGTATVVGVGNVPSEHLVGAHEIAERLGLSHAQSVHTLRRRHNDFPEPIATLKTALIWDWRDIQRWAKSTGRV